MPNLQTKISIESSERLTITRKRYSIRAWCETCQRTSIMTMPSEAAFLACRDMDRIILLIYTGRLHVRHIKGRGIFVCLTSLCMQTSNDEESETETEVELIGIDEQATERSSIF